MINLLCCIFILSIQLTIASAADSSLVQPQSTKKTIIDHLNRTVEVLNNPRRIVTLHPIATQIIYILNAQDKLIAFDYLSKKSNWVQKIDPDWAGRQVLTFGETPPNLEELAALKPDIIIEGAYYPKQVNQIAKVATIVAFDFHSHPAVDAVDLIGKAIGKERVAKELIEYINAKTAAITAITSTIPRQHRPVVFYGSFQSASNKGFTLRTCGNKAYQHGLIEKAGGINIGENNPEIWIALDPELILKRDPYALFARITLSDLKNNPILGGLSSIKNKRYYSMPEGELSFGANAPEGILGLEFMAKKLHPDKFTGLNLEDEVKEFYLKWYRYKLSHEETSQILN
jgi:iron complex transport system substrate-binding protein